MATETCIESNENQTVTRTDRSENAIDEASSGKGDLIGKQRQHSDSLKKGAKSGITDSFGKPDFFDSSTAKSADYSAAYQHGDLVAAYQRVRDSQLATGEMQPGVDQPPAAGDVQPGANGDKQPDFGGIDPVGDSGKPPLGDVQPIDAVAVVDHGPGKMIEKNSELEVSYNKALGMKVTTLPDGTMVSEDRQGNKIVDSTDGSSTRYNAADGSITHTDKDGTETTIPKGVSHTVDDKGTQTVVKSDGSIIVVTKDADRTEFNTDESVVHYDRNGKQAETVTVDENGAVWKTKPDGSWSEKKQDGTLVEFDKKKDEKKTTLPDKTEVTEYGDGTKVVALPDGLQTIRYNPDKSVTSETKHKDGSITSTSVPEGGSHAVTRDGTQAVVDSDGKIIVVDKNGNRSEFYSGRILRRFDPAAKELP
jgi:hypothetical protein